MERFQMAAALFFAINLSVWLGRVEQHTDDTGVLIGLIALGGFLTAMVAPRRPWVWGLIVPAGVILVEVWNQVYGNRNPNGGGAGGLAAIAALTIAVASTGSYVGAFIRRHASLA